MFAGTLRHQLLVETRRVQRTVRLNLIAVYCTLDGINVRLKAVRSQPASTARDQKQLIKEKKETKNRNRTCSKELVNG